jgi:hypothetical protein
VFERLHYVVARVVNGKINYSMGEGPALLLNDDCILDKRQAGRPAINRLNFSPIRVMADQQYGDEKQRQLREYELNPVDPVYVLLPDGTEGIALLSETCAIPANYFRLESIQDESDAGDTYRVSIGRAAVDTRICTMEPHERRLLQEKLALFWTGAALEPVCAVCWEVCVETAGAWTHFERNTDHEVELTQSHKALLGLA